MRLLFSSLGPKDSFTTSGLHRPHLLKTGCHANPCVILTHPKWQSVATIPLSFTEIEKEPEKKEEERRVICDEKLRATNYDFRRKSVTLRHRLSLPEKPLNDSRDLLVIKRQVCPLPLPTTIKHTTCK